MKNLIITPIPALTDNYIWLIQANQNVIIVDPGESHKVIKYIQENHLNPLAIWLTHNHEDHTDGVNDIISLWPELQIIGPNETSLWNTMTVDSTSNFDALGYKVTVFNTPGHTSNHISYLIDQHLFCGDCLFSIGCGRVFTLDYQAQFNSLNLIKQLDKNTLIYCGHEYTLTNLKFALEHSENSEDINLLMNQCKKRLNQNLPTLPCLLSDELKFNPFLNCNNLNDFIQLRKFRDNF